MAIVVRIGSIALDRNGMRHRSCIIAPSARHEARDAVRGGGGRRRAGQCSPLSARDRGARNGGKSRCRAPCGGGGYYSRGQSRHHKDGHRAKGARVTKRKGSGRACCRQGWTNRRTILAQGGVEPAAGSSATDAAGRAGRRRAGGEMFRSGSRDLLPAWRVSPLRRPGHMAGRAGRHAGGWHGTFLVQLALCSAPPRGGSGRFEPACLPQSEPRGIFLPAISFEPTSSVELDHSWSSGGALVRPAGVAHPMCRSPHGAERSPGPRHPIGTSAGSRTRTLDHDEFGSNRSKFMNVIDSKALKRDVHISSSNLHKRDCAGKPVSTYPHPARSPSKPLEGSVAVRCGVCFSKIMQSRTFFDRWDRRSDGSVRHPARRGRSGRQANEGGTKRHDRSRARP